METKFEEWAILELMGHRRLAGKVTDAVIGGGAFLRIDIPGKNGKQTTQYYSPGSVYCITPTSEGIARAVALESEPAPVSHWEFPQLRQGELTPVDELSSGDIERMRCTAEAIAEYVSNHPDKREVFNPPYQEGEDDEEE